MTPELEDIFLKHGVDHNEFDFKDTKQIWLDMPLIIIIMVQPHLQRP